MRTVRGWFAFAALLAGLFAEERPRRTFGLAGLVAIAGGIASATPAIRIHDWHAGLLPGWDSILPLGLTGAGVGAVAAGLLSLRNPALVATVLAVLNQPTRPRR